MLLLQVSGSPCFTTILRLGRTFGTQKHDIHLYLLSTQENKLVIA